MRHLVHCVPCALALIALSAASNELQEHGSTAAAQDASRWTISEQPLVDIGADGSDTLILRAWSALRLSNGSIVVASNRASMLQWFDPSGRHLRTVGRKGQGPAEFGGTISLYESTGDTIVAHDERNRRFHYLNPRGEFVKLDTLGDVRRQAWLYDRSAAYRVPTNVPFARVAATLARIPFSPQDTIRHVRVDRTGNVWIRSATDKQTFAIYSPDSRPLGSITLPPRFDAYQILDTLVLGRWLDADDVEHIQLRRLTRPRTMPTAPAPAAPRPGYDQDAELATHRTTITRLRSLMRNVGTAQEAYFADNRRYAPTFEPLRGIVSLPPEFKFTLFAALPNSYRILGEHPAMRVVCVAIIESDLVPGPMPLCG